ncbi:YkvA family protein [Vibrio vulnificus]|uniref:YkvA family protein n=1 Tax=Vibrio vulnificus TaxID=672 RepID=UPI00215CB4F5|nr:hypothetical protein [Vibrio vulnificus]MCR9500916.1 hypothetical protein [Vibrio vulnificus]MCU8412450.1 hypothetical protein [Vibrio vulnificus]
MQTLSSRKLWKKLKQVKGVEGVVVKALLLFVVLRDDGTPAWVKGVVVVALAYFINPVDPLGVDPLILADDLAVLSSAIATVSSDITPQHHHQARLEYREL